MAFHWLYLYILSHSERNSPWPVSIAHYDFGNWIKWTHNYVLKRQINDYEVFFHDDNSFTNKFKPKLYHQNFQKCENRKKYCLKLQKSMKVGQNLWIVQVKDYFYYSNCFVKVIENQKQEPVWKQLKEQWSIETKSNNLNKRFTCAYLVSYSSFQRVSP